MPPLEVHCDKCGKEFALDPKAIPTDSGGEYISFSCGYCGAEYPVATVTPHGIRLRSRIAYWQERAESDVEHAPYLMELKREMAREVRKGKRPDEL